MKTENTPLMPSSDPLIESNESNGDIIENNGNIEEHTSTAASTVVTRVPFVRNAKDYKIIITLLISVALALASGTLYGFGRYSRDLKESLPFKWWCCIPGPC